MYIKKSFTVDYKAVTAGKHYYPATAYSVDFMAYEDYEESDGYQYIILTYERDFKTLIHKHIKVRIKPGYEYCWKGSKNVITTCYSWEDFQKHFPEWLSSFTESYYRKYYEKAL